MECDREREMDSVQKEDIHGGEKFTLWPQARL
jgi:hypothetical protein